MYKITQIYKSKHHQSIKLAATTNKETKQEQNKVFRKILGFFTLFLFIFSFFYIRWCVQERGRAIESFESVMWLIFINVFSFAGYVVSNPNYKPLPSLSNGHYLVSYYLLSSWIVSVCCNKPINYFLLLYLWYKFIKLQFTL